MKTRHNADFGAKSLLHSIELFETMCCMHATKFLWVKHSGQTFNLLMFSFIFWFVFMYKILFDCLFERTLDCVFAQVCICTTEAIHPINRSIASARPLSTLLSQPECLTPLLHHRKHSNVKRLILASLTWWNYCKEVRTRSLWLRHDCTLKQKEGYYTSVCPHVMLGQRAPRMNSEKEKEEGKKGKGKRGREKGKGKRESKLSTIRVPSPWVDPARARKRNVELDR